MQNESEFEMNFEEEIELVKNSLVRGMRSYHIPEYMENAILNYVLYGIQPGSFLYFVVAGDLFGAAGRADSTNEHLLINYVKFFYNYPPGSCYGSYEVVQDWIETGGVLGAMMANNEEKDGDRRDK